MRNEQIATARANREKVFSYLKSMYDQSKKERKWHIANYYWVNITLEELAKSIGITRNQTQYCVERLVDEGRIVKDHFGFGDVSTWYRIVED